MSEKLVEDNSQINVTNKNDTPRSKKNIYQVKNCLKKLLKHEIREIKAKDYIDAYLRLLEKQNNKLLEDPFINNHSLKSSKNNQLFKNLENNKNKKIIWRNHSQYNIYPMNKSKAKCNISNYSKTLSNKNSPISKKKTILVKPNSMKNTNNSNNSYFKSTFWEDYDFFKTNNIKNNEGKKPKVQKYIKRNTYQNNNNYNSNNDDKFLLTYYLRVLNRRKKKTENYTNEEEKNDKNNLEIIYNILDHIYNRYDLIKKNLEDENIPDFYKRLIVQDKIKKNNLLEKTFILNYKESKKIREPQLSYRSRQICKNSINYEPIDKRLDKIINKKEKDIEKIKNNIEKKNNKNNKNIGRTNSWKKTEEWLINMENWNTNKTLKIKRKKEEKEKQDINNSKYNFKPNINKNAHLKKEDEGIIFSDRLYSEYFTLRQKIEDKIEKQQSNFTFRPKINKIAK